MKPSGFLIAPALGLIVLVLLTACSLGSQQFYDNGVSDAEYIADARRNPDVQAFLAKYPQAETYVDRSGRLAVDFRMTKRPANNTAERWEGIRLRVFIDPKTNQATESFIDCNTKIVREHLKQYLDQYAVTQTCP